MHIWNFVANFVNFPQMTIIHGGILWAIFALTLFALSQNKAPIKIGSVKDLNDGDVKKVLNDIKEKNMNAFTKEIEEKDNVKVNKEN